MQKYKIIYERKQASDLFHDLKRMDRTNFSYDGAKALMEYLEQAAEDCGEAIEYDPIAYCCEYSEYESIEEFQLSYSTDYKTMEDIEAETVVIPVKGDSFIIQQF